MKKALITGIAGQDGSYLAELLLRNGYKVCGLIRKEDMAKLGNIEHIKDKITIIEGDLLDQNSLIKGLKSFDPEEVYNLAAPSFVPDSWNDPITTSMSTGIGVANLLEAIRRTNQKIRFYQASSSEMFGRAKEIPQTEQTPFYPRSPYGAAKLYGYWMTVNYRESYKMFACSGIMFNHESPRRDISYVTRKVTSSAAKIKLGLQKELVLGDLEAKRDWGYAPDYVGAMWLMLQQEKPDDYVICTGKLHSVRELCEAAFDFVGLSYKDFVVVDPKLVRPAEQYTLVGDCSKAEKQLGWQPKVSFDELIRIMVDSDLEIAKKQAANK